MAKLLARPSSISLNRLIIVSISIACRRIGSLSQATCAHRRQLPDGYGCAGASDCRRPESRTETLAGGRFRRGDQHRRRGPTVTYWSYRFNPWVVVPRGWRIWRVVCFLFGRQGRFSWDPPVGLRFFGYAQIFVFFLWNRHGPGS